MRTKLNKRGGCHSYSPTYTFFKPVKHILYSLRSHDYKTKLKVFELFITLLETEEISASFYFALQFIKIY